MTSPYTTARCVAVCCCVLQCVAVSLYFNETSTQPPLNFLTNTHSYTNPRTCTLQIETSTHKIWQENTLLRAENSVLRCNLNDYQSDLFALGVHPENTGGVSAQVQTHKRTHTHTHTHTRTHANTNTRKHKQISSVSLSPPPPCFSLSLSRTHIRAGKC